MPGFFGLNRPDTTPVDIVMPLLPSNLASAGSYAESMIHAIEDPTVLTPDEVHRLIAATKQHHNAALLWTLCSLASKTRNVSGQEFVRGFLQHTLPSRLQRVRYYGWASPNCRLKFQYVQMLVYFYLGWCWLMKKQEVVEQPQRPPIRCPTCKVGHLHLTVITDHLGRVVWHRPLPEHATTYLDSS